jgi:hypothetical protein
MSAYILCEKHFNAIVSYALEQEIVKDINGEAGQKTVDLLFDENVKSVESRYGSKVVADQPVFHFDEDYCNAHEDIISACHCLDYQSCEHADYYESKACKLIREIVFFASGECSNDTWEIS